MANNEDYLNNLIAKAKKSWAGVDVESYMSGLRDNDMKTIEERAKEYAPDPFDPDCILPAREEYIVNQQRNAYIAGCDKQKQAGGL